MAGNGAKASTTRTLMRARRELDALRAVRTCEWEGCPRDLHAEGRDSNARFCLHHVRYRLALITKGVVP